MRSGALPKTIPCVATHGSGHSRTTSRAAPRRLRSSSTRELYFRLGRRDAVRQVEQGCAHVSILWPPRQHPPRDLEIAGLRILELRGPAAQQVTRRHAIRRPRDGGRAQTSASASSGRVEYGSPRDRALRGRSVGRGGPASASSSASGRRTGAPPYLEPTPTRRPDSRPSGSRHQRVSDRASRRPRIARYESRDESSDDCQTYRASRSMQSMPDGSSRHRSHTWLTDAVRIDRVDPVSAAGGW